VALENTGFLAQKTARVQGFGGSNEPKAKTHDINENISNIEEKMILCMRYKDKVKYSELLKEYIIEIAKTRQVNKLESYLLNTILKDENSAERKFYKEIGVNYISIMKNAVKILDAFNECKELVATINSLIFLYS
jgi:hypothetical protein